ncbi:MAG: hypothetical protein JO340_05935 [Acidobacteriaceae bacterium]|nr:hypothetical protein [Acidobacteriaceae bacterium]
MNRVRIAACIAAIAFFSAGVARAQSALFSETGKRLVADYGYWSRTQTPPYSAAQIPFRKFTHINHAGVGFGAKGNLQVPDGFLFGPCKHCGKAVVSENYGTYIKQRIDREGWQTYHDTYALVP